jgi:sortase A
MKKMNLVNLLLLSVAFVLAPFSAEAFFIESRADLPTWIMAPSINLFSPIENVGINDKGEMAVPSGFSNSVGWYEYGVVPGDTGTAVLDAHVFAAFQNLDKIQAGEYIYVFMQSGKILSFEVKQTSLYDLSALSPYTLFEPMNPGKKLNLITCAGDFIYNRSTYSHRLVVSAELV